MQNEIYLLLEAGYNVYKLMALIGRQLRNISNPRVSDAPGPGVYNISSPDNSPMSYAPFSSCNPRFTKSPIKKQLGPGAYEIPTTIGTPSFIKFQNQRNIIIKINDFGSAAFRSRSNRFENVIEETPGVDELQGKKSVKSRKRNVCKSADHPILKIIRQNNHEQNMRYQQQHPKVMNHAETNKTPKSLGPGEYNWENSYNRKQNGTSIWSMSKVRRFNEDRREDLQDSSIVIDNIKREKQKQKQSTAKPSSFFKSQTVKSYFDQITYQTNSSVKLCIRKQLNYKSQLPAPGSYNVVLNKNQKNLFQFFGSTEQRFKEPVVDAIGPGEYILPSDFKLKKTKQIIDQSKRTDFQQNNWLPGPGTYQILNKDSKAKHKSGVQQFGSLEPRFKSEEIKIETDEKDSKNQTKKNFNLNYQQKSSNNNETLPKNKSKSLPHKRNVSSFHSRSNYSINIQEKNTSIPFGIYDLSKDDIGRIAQRDKNYLKQLQQSNLKRPPFNSGIQRFKTQNIQICSSLDVPRLYDDLPAGNKDSSMFKSQTKRNFIDKSHAPGVGSYKLEKSVVKDTFNRKYANKPCGVKTKMAIFKSSQKGKSNNK